MSENFVPRRPIKDNWDRAYLTHLSKVGERYGYYLALSPNGRRPMPLAMMRELGFAQAAVALSGFLRDEHNA